MARNDEFCQTMMTLGRFALVADDHCRWWTTTEAYEKACAEVGGECEVYRSADGEEAGTSYDDFCTIARNLTDAEAQELRALVLAELVDGADIEDLMPSEGEGAEGQVLRDLRAELV